MNYFLRVANFRNETIIITNYIIGELVTGLKLSRQKIEVH